MANILTVGTGGAGNKLLNTQMNLLNETIGLRNMYDSVFINSNVAEMEMLSNFDSQYNALIIGGNGTGKSKDLGKSSIIRERSKFFNFFNSRLQFTNAVNIIFSMDGGFGSSSVPTICNVVKAINPNVLVNLLGVKPVKDSGYLAIENTLDTYADILNLIDQDLVNSITIINNDKMKNEEKFNKQCMQLFLDSFEGGNGGVDPQDLLRASSAIGYKIPLRLNVRASELEDSLNYALNTSPFVVPPIMSKIGINRIRCDYFMAVFNKDKDKEPNIDIDEWRELFRAKKDHKIAYSDNNFVVVSGLMMPDDVFNSFNDALEEDDDEDDIAVDKTSFKYTKKKDVVEPKKEESTTSERQRLKNILSADFWKK